jgi:hypothetical protein
MSDSASLPIDRLLRDAATCLTKIRAASVAGDAEGVSVSVGTLGAVTVDLLMKHIPSGSLVNAKPDKDLSRMREDYFIPGLLFGLGMRNIMATMSDAEHAPEEALAAELAAFLIEDEQKK